MPKGTHDHIVEWILFERDSVSLFFSFFFSRPSTDHVWDSQDCLFIVGLVWHHRSLGLLPFFCLQTNYAAMGPSRKPQDCWRAVWLERIWGLDIPGNRTKKMFGGGLCLSFEDHIAVSCCKNLDSMCFKKKIRSIRPRIKCYCASVWGKDFILSWNSFFPSPYFKQPSNFLFLLSNTDNLR